MNIVLLDDSSTQGLAPALAEFEAAFTYPLGAGQRFGVRHGDDYARFFRAMGEAHCLVALVQGRVVGAIAVVLRKLVTPDGRTRSVAYLGDLKVLPSARGGRVLIALARRAAAWALPRTDMAFSVVMGGTAVTPDQYTGRAGLPAFVELAQLAVVRVALPGPPVGTAPADRPCLGSTAATFEALSTGRCATPAFAPQLRSDITPTAITLMEGDAAGAASGFVEDTRRAKRLVVEDGAEMVSAHLSNFAYSSIGAGARLVDAACVEAARQGFPALFFAVPEADAPALLAALAFRQAGVAPAIVYGHGLPDNVCWNINTSEI